MNFFSSSLFLDILSEHVIEQITIFSIPLLIIIIFFILKKKKPKNLIDNIDNNQINTSNKKEESTSFSIYLGTNLKKYISDETQYNLKERIMQYIEQFSGTYGYGVQIPNICISSDIKPNQVLIKDEILPNRQVLFTVHEDYIFSFDNTSGEEFFTENYPLFYNPVFFYKRDNYSVKPIEIWKNDIQNSIAETQILDLIIVMYKNFAIINDYVFNEEYKILYNDDELKNYFLSDLNSNVDASNENLTVIPFEIAVEYTRHNIKFKSLESLLSYSKSLIDLNVEYEEIDFINNIMKIEENRKSFISFLSENWKIYVYTLSDDLLNEIKILYKKDDLIDEEFEEQVCKLISRVNKSIKPNLRLTVLCSDEDRTNINYFFRTNFDFSAVITNSDLSDNDNYEIVGNIE